MKRLSSRDNPKFKALRRAATTTAARRDANIAFVEGVHLCGAYLDRGSWPRECLVGHAALADAEVAALLARLAAAGRERDVTVLDDALYGDLSRLEQGVAVLFVVDVPRPVPPAVVDRTAVLLERVQDPGNVGSILRSAAAAGIDSVYATADCAGLWSSKVLRAGMGAHFALSLYEGCDARRVCADAAMPRVATLPHATATLFELDVAGPVLWMFGHEGQGLSPRLVDGALAARIPQPGVGESLNVAAAAAVCFFEQVRQRAARERR